LHAELRIDHRDDRCVDRDSGLRVLDRFGLLFPGSEQKLNDDLDDVDALADAARVTAALDQTALRTRTPTKRRT